MVSTPLKFHRNIFVMPWPEVLNNKERHLCLWKLLQYSWKPWEFIPVNISTFTALAEEATESKGGHFDNWSDFLLQKLQSYGEALNFRGIIPLIFAAYDLWYKFYVALSSRNLFMKNFLLHGVINYTILYCMYL